MSRFTASVCMLPLLSVLGATGCATRLGPRSLPQVRVDYMESIAKSTEEQILLNIVRLRDRHLPVFLQVSSVVTQFRLATNVGANGNYNVVAPGGFAPQASAGASAGVAIEERPTITYAPLQGQEFVQRLATPLSPRVVAHLLQGGWSWDVVMACCIRQANGLYAPTYARREQHTDFQRLGVVLHQLQEAHGLSVSTTETGEYEVVFAVPATEDGKKLAAEARQLLGLDPTAFRYRLVRQRLPGDRTTIMFEGRSVLATLYYLSSGVDLPLADQASLGDDALLRVKVNRQPPKETYVAVQHERRHFYIENDDVLSQRVFVLVGYLFSLMSTPGNAPVLTVGAGG